MNLTVFCEVLTRGDDEPTYARSISSCIFAVEYAVPVWPSGAHTTRAIFPRTRSFCILVRLASESLSLMINAHFI